MRIGLIWLFAFVWTMSARPGEVVPEPMAYVEMKIEGRAAPNNPVVRVFFRPPVGYDPASHDRYRVLVYFGGRNCSGENEARGKQGHLGFDQWADKHDIFIVAPGFKDDEYWKPEKWSGSVLREALARIKKYFRIDDQHLLFYGYSAGSQASNLFPAWQPERTRAWVSHAGGVFFRPDKKMRRIPGLVTCGDADAARYIISRRFVENCRTLGINVIFKSYPNLNHTVPLDSARLAQTFLAYYHHLYASDLAPREKNLKPVKEPIEFVGDDQDNVFWPRLSSEVKHIAKEDLVYFPSREIAEAWGEPGRLWMITERAYQRALVEREEEKPLP